MPFLSWFSLKAWFRTISFRLVLIFLVTGILIIIVFNLSSQISLRSELEHNVKPNFVHYAHYIYKEIGYPPSPEKAKKISNVLPIKIAIISSGSYWNSSNQPLNYSDIQFLQPSVKIDDYVIHSAIYKNHFATWGRRGDYDILIIMNNSLISREYSWGTIIGSVIIMALLSILFLFMHWLFKALRVIQSDVKRIGSGDLSHRINVKRSDDLGDLAKTFNNMADDVQNMLEAKRQMLLAISHELRSPITRSKLALAVMPDSRQRESILYDMDEMEALIQDLLEAERLSDKHQTLNLENNSVNTFIKNVVNAFFGDKNISLQLDHQLPKQSLDATRFSFVIKNLLDNALKYHEDDKDAIIIKTSQGDNQTRISVIDKGPGIPDEHIPRLTEPFYRVDPSRQRKTGGFGLGLYLCRLITEAHKGVLTIESELGLGTTVTIELPQ